MKFTDGFWQLRPGVTALYAQEAYDIWQTDAARRRCRDLVVTAPTAVIAKRGDVLNRPTLTVTLSSPLEGVVRVRIAHHTGGEWHGGFDLPGAVDGGAGAASVTDAGGVLTTGPLAARIAPGAPWNLSFEVDGTRVTGSGAQGAGLRPARRRRAGRHRHRRQRPQRHGRAGRARPSSTSSSTSASASSSTGWASASGRS